MTAPAEVNHCAEEAYRRGLAQGAAVAIQQLKEGYGLPELRGWCAAVVRWRYRLPPVPRISGAFQHPYPPELPATRGRR